MMAPDRMMDEFIDKVNRITMEKKVKDFQVFTSVDTWGADAEYIRNGLIFTKFWDNCNKFLEKCEIPSLTFMVTYNALSVFNFHKFIEGVRELKGKYTNQYRPYPTNVGVVDISYLRYPEHQTVKVLPKEMKKYVKNQIHLMKEIQKDDNGVDYFTDMEISKLERILDWMDSEQNERLANRNRKDFGRFFREHDKRRDTSFLDMFPELESLYINREE